MLAMSVNRTENPMTQNDEGNMLAPMWLFDHVAACIRDGKATEEMAQNVECLRGGMEAQAARIAELEEMNIRQKEMLRQADRRGDKWKARAEAAEADVARLGEALGDIAHQKKTTEFAYPAFRDEADFEGGYDECVTRARAALQPKQEDV